MANYIDKTLKIISRHNPDWIKQLIFPDNKEVLSLASFRLEINIPEKRTDDAFEVTLNNGEKKYLFVEFLFGQDKRSFKTYFVKTAMATDTYGAGSVATLVIQITEGPQKAIKAVYKSQIFGITNTFTMPVIHLNTYLEDIEQGTLYQCRKLAQSICQGFENNKNISFSRTCTTMSSIRFLIIQTEMPAIHLSLPEQSLESIDRVSSVVYQGLYEMFFN